MKKIFSILVAVIASVFICHAALAKEIAGISPLAMKQIPANSTVNACDYYPSYSCFSVANFSSYAITVYVPALSFNRPLNPGLEQPLLSNEYSPKQVILYDWRSVAFFNQYVYDRQVIRVTDSLGKLVAQAK